MFIVFEGGEGSGKTSLISNLKTRLEEFNTVITTKEPGGTPIGDKIRNLILDDSSENIGKYTEAVLFSASRYECLDKVIMPNLEKGNIVISDRYIISSYVYQGIVNGVGIDFVNIMNEMIILPDLTFYIDVKPEVGQSRISDRAGNNRMDRKDISFHTRIRDAYLDIVHQHKESSPDAYFIIDGEQSPEAVLEEVFSIIKSRLIQNES